MEQNKRELLNKFWISTFGLNTDRILDTFEESVREQLLHFSIRPFKRR